MKFLATMLLFVTTIAVAQTPATFTKGANIEITWGQNSVVYAQCGSNTKTVTVTHYAVGGIVPHVAGSPDLPLALEVIPLRVDALPLGGTFFDRAGVSHDSTDPVESTALARDYHVPPTTIGHTVGSSSGGTESAFFMVLPAAANLTFAGTYHDWKTAPGSKGIVLHGATDCIVFYVVRDYYVTDVDTLPVAKYELSFQTEWTEQ